MTPTIPTCSRRASTCSRPSEKVCSRRSLPGGADQPRQPAPPPGGTQSLRRVLRRRRPGVHSLARVAPGADHVSKALHQGAAAALTRQAQCWLDARGQHGRHGGRTPCSTPTMSLASSPAAISTPPRKVEGNMNSIETGARMCACTVGQRSYQRRSRRQRIRGCRVQRAGKRRRHRQHAPVAAAHARWSPTNNVQ